MLSIFWHWKLFYSFLHIGYQRQFNFSVGTDCNTNNASNAMNIIGIEFNSSLIEMNNMRSIELESNKNPNNKKNEQTQKIKTNKWKWESM